MISASPELHCSSKETVPMVCVVVWRSVVLPSVVMAAPHHVEIASHRGPPPQLASAASRTRPEVRHHALPRGGTHERRDVTFARTRCSLDRKSTRLNSS